MSSIVRATGIPLLYSSFQFGGETDFFNIMRNYTAERLGDGSLHWEVTCHYSTPEPESNDAAHGGTKNEKQGENDNPTVALPEIDVAFEKFQEVVWYVYDLTTKKLTPCKASNGQVYDPPPMRDASRMIITITRNESILAPHPGLGLQYMDTVNSDVWFGLLPNQVKCQSITAKRQTKQLSIGGVPTILPYLSCSYKFEARPTWQTRLLDQGAYWINKKILDDPTTWVKRKFIVEGHPVVGPLDGFGGKLADGANPVFNTFQFYNTLPFSALNLPQAFLDFR